MDAVMPHRVDLRLFDMGEGGGTGEIVAGETTRAGAGGKSPGMGAKETLRGMCSGASLGALGCVSAARASAADGSLWMGMGGTRERRGCGVKAPGVGVREGRGSV